MDALAVKVTFNLSKFWQDGWTNENLAAELGVHPNTISNLRKGVDKISLPVLLKLSRKVGRPIEDLLDVEEDRDD